MEWLIHVAADFSSDEDECVVRLPWSWLFFSVFFL
jgi:hypothetical protein